MKGALVGKGGSGKTALTSLGSDVFFCSTGSSSMVTDRMSEDGKESHCMSLTVPATLIEQAEAGEMRLDNFLQCIKESLPYAWQLNEGVVDRLHSGTERFTDNQVSPPSEQARGQLLRVLASDAMRTALEQHDEVKLAFQNCHRVAVFRNDA
jgi:hypothetical protein